VAGEYREPECEPMALQPYAGLVVEVVRHWHDHDGRRVAEHRYRARLGDRIIADECNYAMLRARLDGKYARNSELFHAGGADRRSRRYDWVK
jgi:hypothetical protein